MLPVLLHRVANATQRLNGFAALLAVDPAALAARGDDLAETSDRVDDAGWLLALLASASGARLLLSRRERHGLAPIVDAVRDCLRRAERDLSELRTPLPELAPGVADGWQLPWAIATLLHDAGLSLAPRASLAWDLSDRALRCAAGEADLAAFERWLAANLPEARFSRGGGDAVLAFPAGWLRDSSRAPGSP